MAIPKYQYIKDELKNKIISGQFASGEIGRASCRERVCLYV